MSCCRSNSSEESPVPAIIDVYKVLEDYVWTCFTESRSWYQRLFLRRSNYYVDVPRSYFHFENFPRYHKVKHRTLPESQQDSEQDSGQRQSRDQERLEIATDFVNNTNTEQLYNFRLEKTRQTKLNVTIHKGFTLGTKYRLIIGLPKAVSNSRVEAETDMRINITRTDTDAIEETVVLETSSNIKVEGNCKYVIKAVMTETPIDCDFTVVNRMTMPGGGANVAVIRKRGQKVVYSPTIYTSALEKIFKDFLKSKAVKIVPIGRVDGIDRFAADITSQGVIEGVRVSDQSIVLDSYRLPKKDEIKTADTTSTAQDDNKTTPEAAPSTTVISDSSLWPIGINGAIKQEPKEEEEEEEVGDPASRSRPLLGKNGKASRTQGKFPNSSAPNALKKAKSSVPHDDKAVTSV